MLDRNMLRARLFGPLLLAIGGILKDKFPWEPEIFADEIIAKLKSEADASGISKEELLRSLLPELEEVLRSIEQANSQRAKKKALWERIPHSYQKDLLYRFFAWHFFWVCASNIPTRKKNQFDSFAQSRLDIPKKLRKEVSKYALVYATAQLREKEIEQLLGKEYIRIRDKLRS